MGDLCCDHGSQGKICQSAASCPRFCSADNQCQTAMSEACVRFRFIEKFAHGRIEHAGEQQSRIVASRTPF